MCSSRAFGDHSQSAVVTLQIQQQQFRMINETSLPRILGFLDVDLCCNGVLGRSSVKDGTNSVDFTQSASGGGVSFFLAEIAHPDMHLQQLLYGRETLRRALGQHALAAPRYLRPSHLIRMFFGLPSEMQRLALSSARVHRALSERCSWGSHCEENRYSSPFCHMLCLKIFSNATHISLFQCCPL